MHSIISPGSEIRGHRFKETGETLNRNLRDNLFTRRVICICNKLPVKMIEVDTIRTFIGIWAGARIEKV